MAEMLLMRNGRTGANQAETDLLFQQGDIVRIEDDGYPWATEEDPKTAATLPHLNNETPFVILGVQNITAKELDAALYTEGDQFNSDFDTHKRVWHVDFTVMASLFSASFIKLLAGDAVSIKNQTQGGNTVGDCIVRTSTGLSYNADPPLP